jgi:PAS domain S-box-containing protein
MLALVVSPRAWAGSASTVHPHLWAALGLGGAIVSLPVALAIRVPGRTLTRHVIAVAQMLISALLIHLTHGRIETHFHVFGSLAFLAFYRDWRVFIPATLVVALDHYLRGVFWPQSVYGVLVPGGLRWLEHTGWVLFEDAFLIKSCLQSAREMRGIAERRARLEAANELVESAVTLRTVELARSEARFTAFMDHSPAITSIKDPEGRFVYVNRTFERSFGMARSRVIGAAVTDLWDEEFAKPIVDHDREASTREHPVDVIETIPTADGRRHRWTVYRFVVVDGDSRLLASIALDVTEKLELETRLHHLQRMEAVGRLAGGLAHDFNNLLAAVGGYARLLLREVSAGTTARRYVEEIVEGSDKAAALTAQLLAYSRKQVLQPEVVDLNQMVKDTESLLRPIIGTKVELVMDLAPTLNPVMADRNQFSQAVVNLVVNALDSMPGGGRLTIRTANVDAAESESGSEVLLSVGDTGPGLDEEARARVFEPFSSGMRGRHSGLGLPTTHGIVNQSGGRIEVESEIGRGTTFEVRLPALSAQDPSRSARKAA